VSTGDIGESLVGAYMRHVEQCSIVIYNSFFADQQGEVDVVAVKPGKPDEPSTVYLCEVTTHIDGMNPTLIPFKRIQEEWAEEGIACPASAGRVV
jgi:hypothetical protein